MEQKVHLSPVPARKPACDLGRSIKPQGWVTVTDWFPAEVAQQLEQISDSLKAAHASGKPLDTQSFTISFTD